LAVKHLAGTLVACLIAFTALAMAIWPAFQRDAPAPTPSATLSVSEYGATGNGVTDDTTAFVSAMNAAVAKGLTLYVPAGTYKVGLLAFPNGLTMTGAGMDTAWLKGAVTFNSDQQITDLKLGDLGTSTRNGANASNVLFERVRFRGGGVKAYTCPIFLGNGRNSCDHVTFKDCLIERNLGDEDSTYSMGYNNIGFIENGAIPDGSHLDSITFDGCHIGVSNGRTDIPRNIGSPRAGLEAYTWHGGDLVADHGWSNLKVIDCVFEATDCFTIDLADYPLPSGARASGPALIKGNILKGGGYNGGSFAYTICCEAPKGVVIEDNTLYRGGNHTLAVTGSGGQYASGYVIRNNVFALNVDNGIPLPPPTSYKSQVLLKGTKHTFSGNTITTDSGGLVLELQNFANGAVSGNTLKELRTVSPPWALNIWDSHDNVISLNTFITAATTNPVIHYQGTNYNNALIDNVFVHK
jgi:hypothetical protein